MGSKLIIAIVIIIGSFTVGYYSGKAIEMNKNLITMVENREEIERIMEENRVATQNHVLLQQDLVLKLQTQRKEYEKKLADTQFDYSDRLRESEKRSDLYRQQQAASPSDCRALSEHASRLDRSLTEGRELVKRVTGNLRQCELMFKDSVQYLINDRNHLNGR